VLEGGDHPTNLHLVCQQCNRAKGSLNHRQFSALMSLLSQPLFDARARLMVIRKLKAAWRIQ